VSFQNIGSANDEPEFGVDEPGEWHNHKSTGGEIV